MMYFNRIPKLAVAVIALAAAVFLPASAAPVITNTTPQDNAFGVAVNANLVATLSEPIPKGTGNITIYKADATVFETIGVSSAAVTVAG
ncbi:MAG: Ig-like domain-containing protein, partial [Verrucomicrobia bacterium]|nr:Ig-like domain-containing protein [Verrucomicrobiota bacterium]